MTYNEQLIEKYKDIDKVIMTSYQKIGRDGKLVDVTGIVNPLEIDNRQLCAPTDNQGTESSCAAFSIANICEAIIWKKTGKLVNLDAHQIYAGAKQRDGSKNSDGTYLEYAIQAAFDLGGIDASKIEIGFLYNDKSDCVVEQLKFLIHKYDFVHAGFMIQDSWYSCNSYNYYIDCSGRSAGGHAVVICGYTQEGVIIQNSWGTMFGSKGFGIMRWNDFKKNLMYACYVQNAYEGI